MRDVLVVGGSVAGAATAIHLARAGRDVLLIERRSEYGRKACGEGLFPRGVRELDRLGLLETIRVHAAPLAGVRFHAGTSSVAARFGDEQAVGLGVQRVEFDPSLMECARAAGVEVRLGTSARALVTRDDLVTGVRTDGGELAARAIVAADGIGSRLRRQAGLGRPVRSRRYGVSAHLNVRDRAGDFVDVHFGHGYELYVTPVAEQVINVALLGNKALWRGSGGDLTSAFRAVLARHPGALSSAELIDEPLVAGPFGVACCQPWHGNLVLVGDAAGFLDAINGEGMSAALLSARHCAGAVDRYLETGDEAAFRDYAIARRRVVRNADLLARVSLTLASRPSLAQRAVRNLARRPQAFAHLIGISTGELPLSALRPADVTGLALGL